MKNRIRIGFTLNLSNGGPSNFLNGLKSALETQNLAKTSYFFNPFNDCNIYSNVVRNPWKTRFIFRVDGVGFDQSRTDRETGLVNKELSKGILNSAGVVYQSVFSKNLSERILGLKPNNSTIILNGTNLSVFEPKGSDYRNILNIPKDSLVIISTAKWRPRKRLRDTIEIFNIFNKTLKKKAYLLLIGSNEKNEINEVIHIPNVKNSELPKYLRTADLYLFLGWLDPCPNSVVEAIACGLPTICTNTGGTKEILKATNGGIIVNADEDFHFHKINLSKPPKPKYELVIQAMHKLTENLSRYKERINTEAIDINNTSLKYYNFIKETLEIK